MTEALEAIKAYLLEEEWWCDEIHIYSGKRKARSASL